MPVVVLPRWAGALAATAGLTVAGLAAVPASASSHAASSSQAVSAGPSATPRFVRAFHAARLPSGFRQVCPQPTTPGLMQCSIVVHSSASTAARSRHTVPGWGTTSTNLTI